jgi:3-oxoadipate enol-lactonase
MPYADLNTSKIYYETHGEGEPLLCISGLGSDCNEWCLLTSRLSSKYKVIVFDNLLVGKTETILDSISIQTMANETKKFIDYLGIERTNIIGQSMGGMIAISLAAQFPSMINKLILQATLPKLNEYGNCFIHTVQEIFASELSTNLKVDSLLLLILTYNFFKHPERITGLREGLKSSLSGLDVNRYHKQSKVCLSADVTENLVDIKAETLLISAELDNISPPNEMMKMMAQIKKSKLKIINQASHGLQIEQPNQICDYIFDFL